MIWKTIDYEKYQESLSLIRKYDKLTRELYPPNHKEHIKGLHFYQTFYFELGYYTKALPVEYELNEFIIKNIGKESIEYALSMHNLGTIFRELGELHRAESYNKQAAKIGAKVLGKTDPLYGIFLDHLAWVYTEMGLYGKAANLSQEALTIMENAFIKNNTMDRYSFYADCIGRQANIYNQLGDFKKAESLGNKGLALREKYYTTSHSRYARSLIELSEISLHRKNYAQAIFQAEKALKVIEPIFGQQHEYYANNLRHLAHAYSLNKDFGKAFFYIQQAIKIYENQQEETQSDYLEAILYQAEIQLARNQFIEAEKSFTKVIEANISSQNKPFYIEAMVHRGLLYWQTNQIKAAAKDFHRADLILTDKISNNYPYLSDYERFTYQQSRLSDQSKKICSFFATYSNQFPEWASQVFNHTLATKGLALSTGRNIRKALAVAPVENIKTSQWQLANLQKRYSNLAMFSQQDENNLISKNIKNLQEKIHSIQKDLNIKAIELEELGEKMKYRWEDVQKNLQDQEAAISFLRLDYFNGNKWTDSAFYYAMILRENDKHPKLIRICDEEQLGLIIGLEAKLPGYIRQPRKNQELYNLIWKPLEQYLSNVKTVHLSPSGRLHQVAFESLGNNKERLINSYHIHYYDTLRDFIKVRSESEKSKGKNRTITLVGNPSFKPKPKVYSQSKSNKELINALNDAASPLLSLEAYTSNLNYSNSNKTVLKYNLTEPDNLKTLFSAKRRLKAIQKLFSKKNWEAKVLTNENANENQIAQLSGKRAQGVLHITTHGYYTAEEESSNSSINDPNNSMFRSGLILSKDPYREKTANNDGVLTAYEVLIMDLSKTDLVVLSACQSGLGDIQEGEGILGLRRAFKIAGANSLIVSLWKVPEIQTHQLMLYFYQYYLKGMSKSTALRKAKLKMSKLSPEYWAGFILIE